MNKNFKILPVLLLTGFIVLATCEDNLPTRQDTREFTIESIDISRNLETNVLLVQAHVVPGSDAPVDSIWVRVNQPDSAMPAFESPLFDDGTHGDIIPFNNRFSTEVPPGFLTGYLPPTQDLAFDFEVLVRDSLGRVYSQVDSFVLHYNYPVQILGVNAPDTLNAGISEIGLITVSVLDSNGINDVRQVTLQQYAKVVDGDTITSPGGLVQLKNDGDTQNTGDVAAGDSVYSVIIRTVPQLDAGARLMRLVAEDYDQARDTSNTTIYIQNR